MITAYSYLSGSLLLHRVLNRSPWSRALCCKKYTSKHFPAIVYIPQTSHIGMFYSSGDASAMALGLLRTWLGLACLSILCLTPVDAADYEGERISLHALERKYQLTDCGDPLSSVHAGLLRPDAFHQQLALWKHFWNQESRSSCKPYVGKTSGTHPTSWFWGILLWWLIHWLWFLLVVAAALLACASREYACGSGSGFSCILACISSAGPLTRRVCSGDSQQIDTLRRPMIFLLAVFTCCSENHTKV
jgi:hypothetical protein